MSNNLATGYKAAQEAILNQGDTLALLQGLQQCTAAPSTVDLFSGAVACVKDTFQAIRAAGIKTPSFNPEIDAFLAQSDAHMTATMLMNLNQRNPEGGQQLAALAMVVDSMKGRITFNAPKVNNEAPPEPKPAEVLKVEIVGMPTRTTSTEVERDAKGNIDYAVQTERDVA